MKPMSKNTVLQIVLIVAFLLLYMSSAVFFSQAEEIVRRILVLLILLIASAQDICQKEISILLCLGILAMNIAHAFFFSWDLTIWIAAAIVILILFIVHFINRKTIGIGDILLMGFCIATLHSENILLFLFLSFFFSSFVGVVLGLKEKKMRGLTVPLAPCITLAFLVLSFV